MYGIAKFEMTASMHGTNSFSGGIVDNSAPRSRPNENAVDSDRRRNKFSSAYCQRVLPGIALCNCTSAASALPHSLFDFIFGECHAKTPF